MKESLFYIGLTLMFISFIACVISFYLLAFGMPAFLIGAILVLLSKRTVKTKLLTTLMPLVLYIPFAFLCLFFYNYSTPKRILIPKGFDGRLRVVYEEECGLNYRNEEGVETLSFLEGEILILSEDFDRHVNYDYYLIDEFGNKTEIIQIIGSKDRVHKQPYILVGGSGTIGQTIEANSTNREQGGIVFSDFYVYDNGTVDKNDFNSQQKFNLLTRKIVNECRKVE